MPHNNELTPRQMEIFGLLARGLSNPEISELLNISTNTVKIHVTSILRTLNVANRTEAAFAFKELLGPQNPNQTFAELTTDIGRPRIAVLPFADLSGETPDPHFAAGLVEDLISALSAWRWFPVISQSSSSQYGPNNIDLEHVRRELNAKYLVTGSVRRSQNQVRVTAHLIDAAAGEEVWSESFQRPLVDVLIAQAELARHLVAALAPGLLRAEGRIAASRQLTEFNAWELTCRGMWLKNQGNRAAIDAAIEHFDRAIALDAEFPMAFYGRARTHHAAMYDQWTDDHERSLRAMADDVERCMTLDPQSPFSHYISGLMHVVLGNRDVAISHLESTIELNPSFSSGLSLLGQMHGMAGRADECIALLEEALLLNPHSRVSWVYRGAIGTAHYTADRYAESIKWLQGALRDRPDSPAELLSLAAAYVEDGQEAQARQTIGHLRHKRPEFSFKEHMKVFAHVAEPELVQKQIDALSRIGYRLE